MASRHANYAVASEQSIFSKKITIIIYKRVFRAAVNTYVPIFRGLDARGGRKLRKHTHTHTHTHTHETTTVTLTTHARQGLIMEVSCGKVCSKSQAGSSKS